jgi:hypothetical protein
LTPNLNASQASSQWKNMIKELRNPDIKQQKELQREVPLHIQTAAKSNHARKYILSLARFYGDYFATEQGADSNGNASEKKIIPH